MSLGGFSPYVPWSRRRWWAARLILAGLTGLCVATAVLLGVAWVGLVVGVVAALWLAGSFVGERLEHGPRRKGGGL